MGGACGGCCDDRGLKLGSDTAAVEDEAPVKMLKSKKTKQVSQPK